MLFRAQRLSQRTRDRTHAYCLVCSWAVQRCSFDCPLELTGQKLLPWNYLLDPRMNLSVMLFTTLLQAARPISTLLCILFYHPSLNGIRNLQPLGVTWMCATGLGLWLAKILFYCVFFPLRFFLCRLYQHMLGLLVGAIIWTVFWSTVVNGLRPAGLRSSVLVVAVCVLNFYGTIITFFLGKHTTSISPGRWIFWGK